MSDALARALEPPRPGRVVRALGTVLPGVRRTREQIVDHAAHWRDEAVAALGGDLDTVDGIEGAVRRAETPTPHGPIMVVLGDSLSQGIGAASVESTWLHRVAEEDAILHRRPRARIVNLSRSGARIADVIRIQLPALHSIDEPVHLVTCTVGSNDLARGGRPSRVHEEMHSLMSRLPHGSILATLPASGSLLAKRLNRTIRAEAGRAGLVVADVDAHLPGWRGRSAGDRFHPNDLGYESWSAAFTAALVDDRPSPASSRR